MNTDRFNDEKMQRKQVQTNKRIEPELEKTGTAGGKQMTLIEWPLDSGDFIDADKIAVLHTVVSCDGKHSAAEVMFSDDFSVSVPCTSQQEAKARIRYLVYLISTIKER